VLRNLPDAKVIKMADSIIEIVKSRELVDYIRGTGKYKNSKPEVDYSRWRAISDYYAKNGQSDIAREIVQVLFELLDGDDWRDYYAVAGICLNIDTPQVDWKIEQNILKPKFFGFPNNMVSFISKYVMKKQLSGSERAIVENAIKKDHVDWIITLISQDMSQQNLYWDYCQKVIASVLDNTDTNLKLLVDEKVNVEKEKITATIKRLNNLQPSNRKS
jgi:hypothetical protein